MKNIWYATREFLYLMLLFSISFPLISKHSIPFKPKLNKKISLQMEVQPVKHQGLVADLVPNIRIMEGVGHFLFKYGQGPVMIRKIYSWVTLGLVTFQFVCMLLNLAQNTGEVNELTANTITVLFFTHSLVKFLYVAVNSESFHRTWSIWNQPNVHPLFAESDARYHSISLSKMRKLLVMVMGTTLFGVAAWTVITFFGESIKGVFDKATNETYIVDIPRLPIKATYPWDAMHGFFYWISFVFQVWQNRNFLTFITYKKYFLRFITC